MRYGVVLLALLLAACGDDGMTRNFSVSRNSAQDTIGATQTPLSLPPDFAMRPRRPGALSATSEDNAQQAGQSTGSAGQDAFLEAAGPGGANPDVRTKIDENSGLVYPPPGVCRSSHELDAATWLYAAGRAGEEGVVQRLVLIGCAMARTSVGEWPLARNARKVAAASRLASLRPDGSVSRRW